MTGRSSVLTLPVELSLSEAHRWAESRFGVILCADEAGRGPIAGPVVAAAVILPANIEGSELGGLDDSKKLSEKERERLFPLVQSVAVAWGIGEASPEEIDQMNILEATFLAVRRAVEQIALSWDHLLMDGNLPVRGISLERQHAVIRGDGRVLGIAAASVLAKVYRDRQMIQLAEKYPGYGLEKHKGYPSPAHLAAIRELGRSEIHRRSFKVRALGESPSSRAL